MFEDIHKKVDLRESRPRQLETLLSKYTEIKKYQELYGGTVTKKKDRNRERILRNIRREMKKRLRPEETYEVWHDQDHVNVDLSKSKVGSSKRKADTSNTPSDLNESESDEGDHKEESESSLAAYRLQKFTKSFDTTSDWIKSNFIIRTNGLETLPRDTNEGKISVKSQHINYLKTLLHLQMLRRNWDLAYKIFSLLVRLPVDIRSIWPLGIEILRQRERIDSKNEESRVSRPALDEKFFDWLSTFFIIPNKNSATLPTHTKGITAPIWRSGSKYHAPLYIVTALWNLLSKGEYVKLKDKLENLLLEPPFNIEGEFYFLLVLCYIEELVHLANQYLSSKTTQSKSETYNLILSKTKIIEQNLTKCDTFRYLYPKEFMVDQVATILKSLDSGYVAESTDSSSDSEELDSDDNEPLHVNDIDDDEDDEEEDDDDDEEDDERDPNTYVEKLKLDTSQPAENDSNEYNGIDGDIDYLEEDAQVEQKDDEMDFDFDFD